MDKKKIQVASLAQLLPPIFAYMRSPALGNSNVQRSNELSPLLPDCVYFKQLLLPSCILLSCCFPIASASAAPSRFHLLQLLPRDQTQAIPTPSFSQCSRSFIAEFEIIKYKGCTSLVCPRTPNFRYTDTHLMSSESPK